MVRAEQIGLKNQTFTVRNSWGSSRFISKMLQPMAFPMSSSAIGVGHGCASMCSAAGKVALVEYVLRPVAAQLGQVTRGVATRSAGRWL